MHGRNEKDREKEIGNLEKYLSQIENKLNNKNFVANAPDEIVKKEKNKYSENEEKLNSTRRQRLRGAVCSQEISRRG